MDKVDQLVRQALAALDRLLAFVARNRSVFGTLLLLALAWHFHAMLGKRGPVFVIGTAAAMVLSGELKLAILGASIGALFGWTGLAIGLAIGWINGMLLSLGENDPAYRVAKKVGITNGLLIGGLCEMSSHGRTSLAWIIILLFAWLGGFAGEALVGFSRFVRSLNEAHEDEAAEATTR